MADIFISYAREDRAIAERLASAIEASGKSVWWDRHIKGGAQFSKDIERELAAATHVLVLWSAASVESRWVRDEASHAADSNRLIGATIDGTPAPLGFGQFHTVDLQGWGKTGAALPADLAEAIDAEPVAPVPTASATPKSKKPLVIAGTAIAIALAGGTYVATQGLPGSSAAQAQNFSLGIMPLTMQGGGDNEFLGSGLASTIANDLASLEGLQLTSASSTAALAGQNLTAVQIGEQLGVSHLIEGQVSTSNGRLIVDLNLVDTASSRTVWNRRYEGEEGRTQALQVDISRSLAALLQSRFGVGSGRIAISDDVDPRAYDAYLRAKEAQTTRGQTGSRLEAYTQYRRAVDIDPDFAEAQAGLAYLLAISSNESFALSDDEQKSLHRTALQAAFANDPDNRTARAAEVFGSINVEGDLRTALQKSAALVAAAPDFSQGLYAHAGASSSAGNYREAVTFAERAHRADPFNSTIHGFYINNMIHLGDYARISAYFRSCTNCFSFEPLWTLALIILGDEEDFERDWPTILRRSEDYGLPPEMVEPLTNYVAAITRGERAPVPAMLRNDDFTTMTMVAYGGEVEAALSALSASVQNESPTGPIALLGGGRNGFDEAARADPRYHAAFAHPVMQAAVEMRREKGRLTGLPVFPVKPYEGD